MMVDIFAHRGYSSRFFENSREAFEACLGLDIKGIEIDIQLTKDGEMVVIHDEHLMRLLGVDAFVKDLTLDELKSFKYKNGESPITLEEYINIIKDSKLITNAELKTSVFEYPGIEKKVFDIFNSYNLLDRLLVSSFNHYSLLRFKELCDLPVAALTDSTLISPEKYLMQYGFEIYHPVFTSVNREMFNDLKACGLKCNTWTVNGKLSYKMLVDIGVDGIITNYPELDFVRNF